MAILKCIFRAHVFWLFAVSVLSALTSVCNASESQNSPREHVLLQTVYVEKLMQLQDRTTRLEVLLQQQDLKSDDAKSLEKEIQLLQLQIAELKEKVSAQAESQSKELTAHDRRISDFSSSINFWGVLFSAFGLLITVTAFFLGWSAKDKAVAEANSAAKKYFDTEGQNLIKEEQVRLNVIREEHERQIAELRSDLKLQNDQLIAQSYFNRAQEYEKDNKLDVAVVVYNDLLARFAHSTSPEIQGWVAKALINKGNRLGELDQKEAAIVTYDEVLRRFGDATELELKQRVAMALVNKGNTQGELDQKEAAIVTYDEVLRRFGDATELELKQQVAGALVNKGNKQRELDQKEAAIVTYDEVLRRFGDATELALTQRVAGALINKGITQGELDQKEAAIVTYDEVLRRFGNATELELKQRVAMALVNKGNIQGKLDQKDAAIVTYDEVLRRFGDATELELKQQVAMALLNKGNEQCELDQKEDAIVTYDEVLRRFGDATELELKPQVAMALVNKGNKQRELDQKEAAIVIYDEVLRRFGDATELELKQQVTMALVNKGNTQGELDQKEAAIVTYDDVLRRLENAAEPFLKEILVNVHNYVGFYKLINGKSKFAKQNDSEAIKLISDALFHFDSALAICEHKPSDGMLLGNRAYALAFVGQVDEAEKVFAAALKADVNGGEPLYQGTLNDINTEPVPQDAPMRDLVERQWQIWFDGNVE